MTKNERGILSEWQVASHRRRFYGETLLNHRYKTPFAEIDLVLHHQQEASLTMIEVKTDATYIRDGEPVGLRQRQRLLAAREYLDDISGMQVRLLVAVVSHSQESALICRVRYFELANY